MPGKGCYTCRRRRIICDNRQPTCQKCENSGKECLGYQKPLVWVNGVASRGKMVGRNMNDVMGKNAHNNAGDNGGLQVYEFEDQHDGQEYKDMRALPTTRPIQPPAVHLEGARVSNHNHGVFPASDYAPTPRSLADPLFNDFNWLSRSYMFHCKTNPSRIDESSTDSFLSSLSTHGWHPRFIPQCQKSIS